MVIIIMLMHGIRCNICELQMMLLVIRVKEAYLSNKLPLVLRGGGGGGSMIFH